MEQQVTASADAISRISVNLQQDAPLCIVTKPAGFSVLLGKREYGPTPVTINGLAQGEYPLLLQKPNYNDIQDIVNLQAGKVTEIYEDGIVTKSYSAFLEKRNEKLKLTARWVPLLAATYALTYGIIMQRHVSDKITAYNNTYVTSDAVKLRNQIEESEAMRNQGFGAAGIFVAASLLTWVF